MESIRYINPIFVYLLLVIRREGFKMFTGKGTEKRMLICNCYFINTNSMPAASWFYAITGGTATSLVGILIQKLISFIFLVAECYFILIS